MDTPGARRSGSSAGVLRAIASSRQSRMTRERLYLFDTTLRDGQQSQGVDFSADDKAARSRAPSTASASTTSRAAGPAPTRPTAPSSTTPPKLAHATPDRLRHDQAPRPLRRRTTRCSPASSTPAPRRSASSARPTTSTSPPPSASSFAENLAEHRHLDPLTSTAKGREPLFDAEHFFDGWKANPDYALSCLKAALDAGARWIVLCDTNGGTLPAEVGAITARGRRGRHPRRRGSASTPTTTPATPSPTRSPPSTPAPARSRAR